MSKIKLKKVLKEGLEESVKEIKRDQLFKKHLQRFDKKFEELKTRLKEGGFNV